MYNPKTKSSLIPGNSSEYTIYGMAFTIMAQDIVFVKQHGV
jgi:hypothetical protein